MSKVTKVLLALMFLASLAIFYEWYVYISPMGAY
jgi:hypothetical protein